MQTQRVSLRLPASASVSGLSLTCSAIGSHSRALGRQRCKHVEARVEAAWTDWYVMFQWCINTHCDDGHDTGNRTFDVLTASAARRNAYDIAHTVVRVSPQLRRRVPTRLSLRAATCAAPPPTMMCLRLRHRAALMSPRHHFWRLAEWRQSIS